MLQFLQIREHYAVEGAEIVFVGTARRYNRISSTLSHTCVLSKTRSSEKNKINQLQNGLQVGGENCRCS